MEKQFVRNWRLTHKCPNCNNYHTCDGRSMSHEIYCPANQRRYTILTGRAGRQVGSVLQVKYRTGVKKY